MSVTKRSDFTTATTAALNGAQHLNWSSIPVEHPAEGIERQMVAGQSLMICRFRFMPLLVTPEHTHPHEQMSLVVSGRVLFLSKAKNALHRPAMFCTFLPTVFTARR